MVSKLFNNLKKLKVFYKKNINKSNWFIVTWFFVFFINISSFIISKHLILSLSLNIFFPIVMVSISIYFFIKSSKKLTLLDYLNNNITIDKKLFNDDETIQYFFRDNTNPPIISLNYSLIKDYVGDFPKEIQIENDLIIENSKINRLEKLNIGGFLIIINSTIEHMEDFHFNSAVIILVGSVIKNFPDYKKYGIIDRDDCLKLVKRKEKLKMLDCLN